MEKYNILTPNPRFRILPKTGQETSYATYDDGDFELGWKKGRHNSNNQTRFVAKIIAGNSVILDYATRLMWSAEDEAGGAVYTWANAVAYAQVTYNAVNGYAGFFDWRLPNIYELVSLLNFNVTDFKYPIFNFLTLLYQSSTTSPVNTASCIACRFGTLGGIVASNAKTSSLSIRICRSF
jgi:hypothetical protein